WLAVHPDNRETLFTGKVDTGTGTQTALAQIAAEELDFPVERLDVVMGTTSETVDQGPSYGSLAIRMAGPQIRHAAAAGRAVLLDLAAKHFKVPADRLVVREGIVEVSGVPDQKITYGELVDGRRLNFSIGASGESFAMKVAPRVRTKDPSTYTVVGRPIRRKDIPAKATAAFTYVQTVQHARHAHVLNVRECAGYLGWNILAADRATHDRVSAGILGAHPRRDFHREALAAGADTEIQAPAVDELTVRDLLIGHAADLDDALAYPQPVRGNFEMLGGKIEQHRPAGGRGVTDLRPGHTNRKAAVTRSLIHGLRGRTHHHVQTLHRKIQLLGGDLGQRRLRPGAGVHLAGEERRPIVGMYREPRRQQPRRRRFERARVIGPRDG